MPDDSEIYGRIVRAIWVDWALEQPDVADHPSWTLPWDKLADRDGGGHADRLRCRRPGCP